MASFGPPYFFTVGIAQVWTEIGYPFLYDTQIFTKLETNYEPVAQGQYMVSDMLCPAFSWSEGMQGITSFPI